MEKDKKRTYFKDKVYFWTGSTHTINKLMLAFPQIDL